MITATKTKTDKYLKNMPSAPDMLLQVLSVLNEEEFKPQQLTNLTKQYPVFFQYLLEAINQDQIVLPHKVDSIEEFVKLGARESLGYLLQFMVLHKRFSQYKIRGFSTQEFWQDSLHRAVCARMLGNYIGLDSSRCFLAGMLQDIGLFLLFLDQPTKAVLWSEFRKREPQARYSMEDNIFSNNHTQAVGDFCQQWMIEDGVRLAVMHHHQDDISMLSIFDQQLARVLMCADWMAAIYTAEDKSFVIDRTLDILSSDFELARFQIEKICASVPQHVDKAAHAFQFELEPHQAFAQVVMEANYKLSADNDNFQELTLRLEQALDERDKLAEELNRELSLAREIQKSLLPKIIDSKFPVCGINLSARDLSGDFYDYFELDDGSIYFNLGDVSGKGVNAALLMAKASSLFRCLGKRINNPSDLLAEVNRELCETSINGMFVTMIAGLYQPSTDCVEIVNAGNPPALLFSNEGIAREIPAQAPPLGIVADAVFPLEKFYLQDNSLYIFSDGVTEGYLENHEMLELGGLYKLISKMDKNLSPMQRIQSIADCFQSSQRTLRDDVTLVLLEKQT